MKEKINVLIVTSFFATENIPHIFTKVKYTRIKHIVTLNPFYSIGLALFIGWFGDLFPLSSSFHFKYSMYNYLGAS